MDDPILLGNKSILVPPSYSHGNTFALEGNKSFFGSLKTFRPFNLKSVSLSAHFSTIMMGKKHSNIGA